MANVTYGVEVQYMQTGALAVPSGIKEAGTHIDKANKGLGSMNSLFSGIGSAAGSFNSVLDSVIGTLANVAIGATTAMGTLVAGGFALAVKEAFHFNEEMENTQISLAAIASASGTVKDFESGMERASTVISMMRKDARDLPGSFQNLQDIMATISPATANAGLGMIPTEKIAADLMATAAVLRVPFSVAGREFGMMLGGVARHNMPLFLKMGFTDAKAFNKLPQEKRLEELKKKLEAMGPAREAFMNSWRAIADTTKDTFKQAFGYIGGPLFEGVKEKLKWFNNLGAHSDMKEKYIAWADKLGNRLFVAFDQAFKLGERGFHRWSGLLSTFLHTMKTGMTNAFGHILPVLSKAGDYLEKFMNDPKAFEKLESIGSKLLAARVGMGALQTGAGIAGSGMSMLGGAAALGGGGVAGLAAAAWPAAIALVALGGIAVAAYGAFDALTDVTSDYNILARTVMMENAKSFAAMVVEGNKLVAAITPIVDLLGVVFLVTIQGSIIAVTAFTSVLVAAFETIRSIPALAYFLDHFKDPASVAKAKVRLDDEHLYGRKGKEDLGADRDPHKPPNTNVSIHKVEIVVNSNQDPSRVARATVDLLKELARSPTSAALNPSSRFVR